MKEFLSKKIVITGGSGFLGSHVKEALFALGVSQAQISIPRSASADLKSLEIAKEAVRGADYVFHLAGINGGIEFNREIPGKLFFENAAMGLQVIEACAQEKVGKLICVGSSCSYPKDAPLPLSPKDFWIGYPEPSSAPYAMGKKIQHVMLESYYKQYGLKSVYVIPSNLYGPGDNFEPQSSHVIAAMLKKFSDAVKFSMEEVSLWGDGSPRRDFLYVEDAARGIIQAALTLNQPNIINLSSGSDISIFALAQIVARTVGFEGKIIWDGSKPNGQPLRQLEQTKLIPFEPKTDLREGLEKTWRWLLESWST